jgi:XTP/dITP diphosphohydrolase
MKLLLATSNAGKITEISECLEGLSVEIVTPDTFGISQPDETEDTFEGNAVQKAKYYFEKSGIPSLADDSGIVVEALQKELGVHTRRWGAGPEASDEEWIAYFLDRMEKEENKRASFVCVLAHVEAGGRIHTFEGRCSGVITDELEADYLPGLPISACFRPDGFDLVYSAMTVEQKNAISHRGKACRKLREFLASNGKLKIDN